MNEIQELKNRREQTILEKETLERELAPFAAALEDYEVLQSLESNLRYEITDKKREVGYRERDIDTLDKKYPSGQVIYPTPQSPDMVCT